MHADADALSRFPVENSHTENCDIWRIDLSSFDVAQLQKNDAFMKKIIDSLLQLDARSSGHEPSVRNLEDYAIHEDVLYKANFNITRRSWKLCIPSKLKLKIMKSIHEDEVGGHLGSARMYHLMSERYFWKGMFKNIKRYVRSCRKCDLFKPRLGKKLVSCKILTK